MSCTNKEDMIKYMMEFDRTFGGPLSHLFEQEKVSKYKEMTICELKNLCFFNRSLYMLWGKMAAGERQETKPAKEWGAPACKYRKM